MTPWDYTVAAMFVAFVLSVLALLFTTREPKRTCFNCKRPVGQQWYTDDRGDHYCPECCAGFGFPSF